MNNQPNHLTQRTACEGSGKERVWVGEERCWTQEQIKRMPKLGFEPASIFYFFDKPISFRRTTVKAWVEVLLFAAACVFLATLSAHFASPGMRWMPW